MEIKVCTCRQCKCKKANRRTNFRKRMRRMTNKKRRKMDEGEVFNLYYA